jgi:hypothetical protein
MASVETMVIKMMNTWIATILLTVGSARIGVGILTSPSGQPIPF